jgi:ParB-like chromosome segregation protein Spo0J
MTEPKSPSTPVLVASLVAHPLAETFPMIGDVELKDLAEDIRKNGLREPIVIFESKILDGRNRVEAGKLIDFQFTLANFRELSAGTDPQAYVISANIHRRHLTTEQKREVIGKLLKADPTKSDRAIASIAKADNKTVASKRKELEATEEIPQLKNRTGADGKARATNKKPKAPNPAKAYKAKQEELMDALRELELAHAEDKAEETKARLDETLASMKEEEKKAA